MAWATHQRGGREKAEEENFWAFGGLSALTVVRVLRRFGSKLQKVWETQGFGSLGRLKIHPRVDRGEPSRMRQPRK